MLESKPIYELGYAWRTLPWKQMLPYLLVLAILGLWITYKRAPDELPVYMQAAERMLAGDEIYRPNENKPFTYPPFFAIPFIPVLWLPEVLQKGLFFLVNMSLTLAILVLLRRMLSPWLDSPPPDAAPELRHSRRWRKEVLFWALCFFLAGRHVSAVFENQSHDLIVFFFVMLGTYAYARRQQALSGASLGIAAACKATPIVFLPVYVWQGQFRAALAGAVVVIGMLLLPDLLFPREADGLWVQAWFHSFVSKVSPGEAANAEGAWSSWNFLNQSLTGTLHRLSTPLNYRSATAFDVSLWNPSRETLKYTGYALQLGLIAITAFSCLPRWSRHLGASQYGLRKLGEAGLLVCCMLLLSPMSSKSHFCVLLIPISYCLLDLLYRKRDPIVAALMTLIFLTGTITTKGLLGVDLGNEFLARGTVTFATLCAFLATAHILFYNSRANAAKD